MSRSRRLQASFRFLQTEASVTYLMKRARRKMPGSFYTASVYALKTAYHGTNFGLRYRSAQLQIVTLHGHF